MSDAADRFTRRAALARLGATGAAGLGAVDAAAALADPADKPVRPSGPPKYIFGYGSLMQTESRRRTDTAAFAAAPVLVKGITRGWYYQAETPSWSPTYLGAVDDKKAAMNGVVYQVSDVEFAATQAREADYKPTRIDRSSITMLGGNPGVPEGEFWYFASKTTPTGHGSSQTSTVASELADASARPLAATVTPRTAPRCPHSRMVWSELPEASVLPSAEKATTFTWPRAHSGRRSLSPLPGPVTEQSCLCTPKPGSYHREKRRPSQ